MFQDALVYEDVFHGKAAGEPVRISIRAAHPGVGVSTRSTPVQDV